VSDRDRAALAAKRFRSLPLGSPEGERALFEVGEHLLGNPSASVGEWVGSSF
jgi:hypothetical protein